MNSNEILIIDDEPAIRKMLEIMLTSNGYSVRLAENAREGISLAASHMPGLILLDIGLPDKSGHDVLRDLRTWYTKPIIILSVINQEEDVVSALDHGANDYLTKPFRNAELLARIRSAMQQNKQTGKEPLIRAGKLQIDLAAHTVRKHEQLIKLTSTEFKLLALLAVHEDRVLTHQFILKEIWGIGFQKETQYLRVFIGTLRRKIEDDPNRPGYIITESGVGYRFTHPL